MTPRRSHDLSESCLPQSGFRRSEEPLTLAHQFQGHTFRQTSIQHTLKQVTQLAKAQTIHEGRSTKHTKTTHGQTSSTKFQRPSTKAGAIAHVHHHSMFSMPECVHKLVSARVRNVCLSRLEDRYNRKQRFLVYTPVSTNNVGCWCSSNTNSSRTSASELTSFSI